MGRRYLTANDEKIIKKILKSTKRQHIKRFDIEDYCRDNGIDYDSVASTIDSFRISINMTGS